MWVRSPGCSSSPLSRPSWPPRPDHSAANFPLKPPLLPSPCPGPSRPPISSLGHTILPSTFITLPSFPVRAACPPHHFPISVYAPRWQETSCSLFRSHRRYPSIYKIRNTFKQKLFIRITKQLTFLRSSIQPGHAYSIYGIELGHFFPSRSLRGGFDCYPHRTNEEHRT